MTPLIIMVAAFLGVTALIVGVAAMAGVFDSSKAEDRLAVMTRGKKADGEAEGIILDELFPEAKNGLAAAINNLFERLGKVSRLFDQADCPIKPETFYGVCAGCGFMGVVATMIGHAPMPLYPLGAVMGAALPWGWLLFRRRSRFKKFSKQLPDAL